MKQPVRAATALLGAGAGVAASLLLNDVRVSRDLKATSRWRRVPVLGRGKTQLGISFRPLQAEAMGLEAEEALVTLLREPFPLVRLAAHWARVEASPGQWSYVEVDRYLDAAERAGKQIVLGVGAVKNFGYPEFFVPAHRLAQPLKEGSLISPATHPDLLDAAAEFVTRLVERYRDHQGIIAWQVEHEAVDPLGLEHSWRLSTEFVGREMQAVRAADNSRPVVLNGFLPTSLPVWLQQRWRTRDQGDSISLALRSADVVGLDIYPRHALVGFAGAALYLNGWRNPLMVRQRRHLLGELQDRRVMVTEGQAEPWETVTVPPALVGRQPYSCPPEAVIANYNRCLDWTGRAGARIDAYLFWGAEYWLRRYMLGDPEYLAAFRRVLEES